MRRLHLPKLSHGCAVAALGFAALGVGEVAAQEAAHIGEIKFGAYSSCPLGWVEANGQTLPIEGNELLFSVIGIAYGGDGETNFAVPNVQGVVSIPVVLTPTPAAQQGIQQQEIKRQPVRRQKITRHDMKEETVAEEPAAGSPTGTPLLACIALVGVLPTDPAAAPPTEEPPVEEPPIEQPPVEEPGGEEPPAEE
jgi:Phage Tail Collar Domain